MGDVDIGWRYAHVGAEGTQPKLVVVIDIYVTVIIITSLKFSVTCWSNVISYFYIFLQNW